MRDHVEKQNMKKILLLRNMWLISCDSRYFPGPQANHQEK